MIGFHPQHVQDSATSKQKWEKQHTNVALGADWMIFDHDEKQIQNHANSLGVPRCFRWWHFPKTPIRKRTYIPGLQVHTRKTYQMHDPMIFCAIYVYIYIYIHIYIPITIGDIYIYIYDIYHNFPIMITISPMITANPRVFQPIGESPPRDRTSRSQRLNFRTISWLAGVANISSLGEAEALLRPWYGWIYWMRSRLRRTFLRGQEAVLEKISPL